LILRTLVVTCLCSIKVIAEYCYLVRTLTPKYNLLIVIEVAIGYASGAELSDLVGYSRRLHFSKSKAVRRGHVSVNFLMVTPFEM
jgi:hypothetical protein